jgi:hypothetical protein
MTDVRYARLRAIELQRQHCRRVYNKALREGELVRPTSCQDCGVVCKPEGHHDDYDKPVDVRWLCIPCHRLADKAVGSRKRDYSRDPVIKTMALRRSA